MAMSQAESARRAKSKIENKEVFRIGDIFSQNIGNVYVVYSYGTHYPMFLYNRETNIWYENMTKYSHTTSARHKNNCRPHNVAISVATTESLNAMICHHEELGESMTVQKYKIVRFYQHKTRRTINTGLTLEQAQEHCNNPETSWQTCRLARNKKRTRLCGAWFDAYEKE